MAHRRLVDEGGPGATLVMDALMMAVWRRGKADTLLHHSDQGSQYTSEQFQRLLLDNGIVCSPLDNGIVCSPLGSMLRMRLPGSA